jgi:signal transduction histidine kinase
MLTTARADTVVEETERIAVHELLARTWETTDTGDATLEIDLAREWHLECDPDLVQQVFENLFRNAIDHNEGPITVTVGRETDDSDATVLYVADDGTGVPADERDRVFDHGFSTSSTGTGLGLSIVADLVDSHGWSIAVTESQDGGARFEITIADANLPDPPAPTAPEDSTDDHIVPVSDE